MYELGHDSLNGFCFTSGIGCTSWIPSPYFLADSIHTLHGRSIPVATSIKLIRPDLNMVVFGGDGDIVGIGLSHFIHAARRNVDIVVIMGNNMVYAMTGGQVAPTTPFDALTATSPSGNFEYPLDSGRLAMAAGATYLCPLDHGTRKGIEGVNQDRSSAPGIQIHRGSDPVPSGIRA